LSSDYLNADTYITTTDINKLIIRTFNSYIQI